MKEKLNNLWNKAKQWIKETFTFEHIACCVSGMIVMAIYNSLFRTVEATCEYRHENGDKYTVTYNLKGDIMESFRIDEIKKPD